MNPDRKYWGPYCVWPREPGPYVHEIYPVGFGCIMDGGVIRSLTPAELDGYNDALAVSFRRTFVEDARFQSNTRWFLPERARASIEEAEKGKGARGWNEQYQQTPMPSRHNWDRGHTQCLTCKATIEQIEDNVVGEFCPGPPK